MKTIAALVLTITSLQYAGAGEPVLVRDWTLSGSTKNISWGSGFGVGGVVVTAAHVVKGGQLEVKTKDGWKKVTVLTRDDNLDLAVLTTPGDVDEYSLAEKVGASDQFLIQGFPLGERKTIKASAVEKHGGKVVLDARGMDHGFSGAPVVDSRGCVVGVAVSGLVADEGGGDMDHRRAMAVPLDALRAFVLPYLRSSATIPPDALRVSSTPPQTRAETVPPPKADAALITAFNVSGRKWRAVRTPAGLVFERAEPDALGVDSWRKCAPDYASDEWSKAAVLALAESK